MGYIGVCERYVGVPSKIIFYLLQDGCKCFFACFLPCRGWVFRSCWAVFRFHVGIANGSNGLALQSPQQCAHLLDVALALLVDEI